MKTLGAYREIFIGFNNFDSDNRAKLISYFEVSELGLDYRYLLYFQREQLWDVLEGVSKIAVPHHPPVDIYFPDRVLSIPMDSWIMREKKVSHDDPEFSFSVVLKFEPDDAILDYVEGLNFSDNEEYRSPPEPDEDNLIHIGYIYLTIFQKIPEYSQKDLVLFDFGTTGTRMSKLFYYSTSIRRAFLELLQKYQGICGVFNNEIYGDVFWFNEKQVSQEIDDPYMKPDEIETILSNYKRRTGNGNRHRKIGGELLG